jgi:putative spermidine/putrescine transport system ATP-binding protein
VTGHVRDVVYLGPVTRYTVELDPGGALVVLRQNLDQSSMEALEVQGQAVRLAWAKENERRLHGDMPSNGGEAP